MRILATISLVAVLAVSAGAQQPRQPGGFGGFGGFGGAGLAATLTFNRQLQEELKMDEDQLNKLREAQTGMADELRDILGKLRDASPEERTGIMRKLGETQTKAVHSVLKPQQIKRLNQIENQQAGLNMYTKEDVQKSLKLSEEQIDKIKVIAGDLQKDTRELRGGGGGGRGFGRVDPQVQRKIDALQKEAQEKIEDLLTSDQKNLVKDLTGEPFKLDNQGFGGFGGGGGFGGLGGGGSQPGKLFSPNVQNTLKLTDEQKKQIEDVQKEVDAKLEKILTEEQRKQLKDLQQARPFGGFGRPGGANPPPPQ